MAVKTRAIISGTVLSVTTREGMTKGDPDKGVKPKPYRIVTALVVGPNTLIECTIDDALTDPTEGEVIQGEVVIDVYRAEDQARLVKYL